MLNFQWVSNLFLQKHETQRRGVQLTCQAQSAITHEGSELDDKPEKEHVVFFYLKNNVYTTET